MRLSFVKLMLSHPNLLMMDEPTNHLDLIGKEALEDSLNEYEAPCCLSAMTDILSVN